MDEIPIGAQVYYVENGRNDIGRVVKYKPNKGYRVRWLYGDWRDSLDWYQRNELVRL